jgi:hypothetical protein|tara:strand:- start:220 stop:690 length:471 start_codon:yes stop_codon:yes gene_type:complete
LISVKSFYDFLKRLTKFGYHQNLNFWNSLDDTKKKYSQYMINRYLSMEPDFITLVNDIQILQGSSKLSDKHHFLLWSELLPNKNIFFKYIGKDKSMNWPKQWIEIVSQNFQISQTEAVEAMEMYMVSEGGKLELYEILTRYGIAEKDIRKVYDYES